MKHTIIAFGLLVFSVLLLFQIARFSRFQSGWSTELWIAAFSIIFLFIGIFLSKKLQKEKIVEKKVFVHKEEFTVNKEKLEQLNISKREYEVLQLICKGMSNQQIAEALFVSENTVKKHVSNLFLKLNVERRTEAIRKARELSLVQ
ncbi:MAG: response regulator transcription factor [Bacteroidota bacterium]|nr:response regulator transcription factor [Bacteroidota bacterium]